MLKKILYSLLLSCPLIALAEPVTYQANQLKGEVLNGKSCRRLEGNVTITLDTSGIILTADQAYKYDDSDVIEAEGNVKIVDRDGSVLTSNRLIYDLSKKEAIFSGNVSCTSKKANFYTSELIYNVETKQGRFSQKGKLVQDQMVLTSPSGLYDGINHQVTFANKVALVDPNYSLDCEALVYYTHKEIAYFKGETKVVHQDGLLTTSKGGNYLVPKKHLVFHEATLTTPEVVIMADSLKIFDDQNCLASGHVSLSATKHDALIVGEKANYDQKTKQGQITGNPLLTKVFKDQNMYLRADTFMILEKSIDNKPPEQEIYALNNVKLYQEELQGIADGAVYNSNKNTIHLQNNPIIWCGNYQITGQAVYLVVEEDKQVKLFVDKDLFMASADPVGNYNQLKGNKMVALFKEGAIEQMSIIGNSESLYFALGDKNELMGMNHIKSDTMEMTMQDNALGQMTCKPKPHGIFYPTEKIEESQIKLDGFVWHGEQWPTKENILAGVTPSQVDASNLAKN